MRHLVKWLPSFSPGIATDIGSAAADSWREERVKAIGLKILAFPQTPSSR
jgi:hypothetical protein